ncbi:hypothetical protein KW782_04195 [Candidatus Parcubacteria bacterium]|nr:hypothetical protein [Candidatus Parcubacteria bacterium]
MERSGKTIVKIVISIIAIVSIGGYALYQAQNLINGPELNLEYPINGSTLNTPAVAIKGIAKNVAYISLNNRQIFIDNEGLFNEELVLAPGYNIWTLEAKDKFGRSVSKKIELILNQPEYTSL